MVSSLISAIPSLISGAVGLATSKQQQKRAQELVKESKRLKARPLEKEFEQSLRASEMMATQGNPATTVALDMADSDVAANLRAIRESSPSGSIAAAAIASQLGTTQRAKQGILAQDAEQRMANQKAANQMLLSIGKEKSGREVEKMGLQQDLIGRAASLEDNALARRETSIGTMLKGVTSPLTTAGEGLEAGIGAAINFEQEKKEDMPGYKADAGDAFTKAAVGNLFKNKAELSAETKDEPELTEEQFKALDPDKQREYLMKRKAFKK